MEPQQIIQMLRRRGWKVLCWSVALGIIVGLGSYLLQDPVYESAAQVYLQQGSASSLASQSATPTDAASFAASQVIMVRSIETARAAVAHVPGKFSPEALLDEIRVVPSGSVLYIIARSGNREHAQAVANAFATAYIANQPVAVVASLQSAIDDLAPQLTSLQNQIADLDEKIRTAQGTPGALQAQRDATVAQYQALFTQQAELRVQMKLTHGAAQLVSPAPLPGKPISPTPFKAALLGATAGLLIGLGIELLREKFDDKVSSGEELAAIISQPVLAELPDDDAAAGSSPTTVRPGEFGEAMRTLRTSLQFLGVDKPLRRIVVSSSGTGDGKTTVAANLAAAYAEAGFRTVLVSADLRRPQIESLFGAAYTGLGLSTLLASGEMRPRSAASITTNGNGNGNGNGHSNGNGNGNGVHAAGSANGDDRLPRLKASLRLQSVPTALENLIVIPGGPVPPNPAELLGSTRMREILDVLDASADMIIIDTPPALVVTDSVVLADASDGVLIVASATKTTRRDLKRLMSIYETADVPILGSVLNRAPRTRGKSAYYDAYYNAEKSGRISGLRNKVAPRTIDLRDEAQEPAQESTNPASL